jgi:hypothetical protein
MAKAVQLDLTANVVEEEGWGKVILNNPAGTLNLIVQVDLKGAALEAYDVWICDTGGASLLPLVALGSTGWFKLGVLETNVAGNGTLHCNVTLEVPGELELMVYLDPFDNLTYDAYVSEAEPIEIK